MFLAKLAGKLGCLSFNLGLLLAQGVHQGRLQDLADRYGTVGSVQEALDLAQARDSLGTLRALVHQLGVELGDLLGLEGAALAFDQARGGGETPRPRVLSRRLPGVARRVAR